MYTFKHIEKNDSELKRRVFAYIQKHSWATHNSVILGENIHALDVLRIIRELKHDGNLRECIQPLGNKDDSANSLFYTVNKAYPDFRYDS